MRVLPRQAVGRNCAEQWKTFVFSARNSAGNGRLLEVSQSETTPIPGTKPVLFHVERFPIWARFPKCFTWNVSTIPIYNPFKLFGQTLHLLSQTRFVAACLAIEGLRVLLVDCDPQANCSSGLGFQRDDNRRSIYDVLMGDSPAEQVILPTEIDLLSLLPGSKNLTGANIELAAAEDRALRLRRALEPVQDELRSGDSGLSAGA